MELCPLLQQKQLGQHIFSVSRLELSFQTTKALYFDKRATRHFITTDAHRVCAGEVVSIVPELFLLGVNETSDCTVLVNSRVGRMGGKSKHSYTIT